MSIQVKELAFVFHAVSDVAAAREFYEKNLGLKTSLDLELAPGKWWIEYNIAGQALAISNTMGPSRRAAAVVLEVANLDDAYATAKAAGIKITHEISNFRPCRMFEVSDPDGNLITFHQLKTKA